MCLFLMTLLLGPRIAIFFWWLVNPVRFSDAFSNFLWPLFGLIFFPWTTLMWVAVWSINDGVNGVGWLFIALGMLADVSLYASAGPTRSRAPTAADYSR